jgi:dUTP pyrophosphatase
MERRKAMERIEVFCKKLSPEVSLPGYQTRGSSGMDLHAHIEEPAVLKPGQFSLIPCGIALSIPEGFEAQIRPRSGLAARHGITILNSCGTIDSDYRGEVQVIMINLGPHDYQIKPQERIAQMIFARVAKVELVIREELDPTPREAGGFGHTGR